VIVRFSGPLNTYGMVVDFTHVKRLLMDTFDHQDLNMVMRGSTTAENLAHAIGTLLSLELPRILDSTNHDAMLYPHIKLDSVTVFETPGNEVTVEW